MSHRIPQRAALAAAFCLLLGTPSLWTASAWGQVAVQFDAGQTVACHDVTTESFAADHPGERLLEAKLEISSLLQGGRERALTHYFYQVDSLDEAMVFIDYLPQTTLDTEFAGSVNVDKKHEQTSNLGLAVTLDTIVKVTPSAGAGSKRSTQVQYSLLPPKEQVAASGTQRRGRGVYFKLKPSSQHTLEGAKEFALVFRVPRCWRAGTVLLRCEAQGLKRAFFRDEQARVGKALFMLALYQAGDGEAKLAARQYAAAELKLRQQAHRERDAIERAQSASTRFTLAGTETTPARIPVGWLERLLVMPGEANWPHYEEHLPAEVRRSGELFLSAKLDLQRMARPAALE